MPCGLLSKWWMRGFLFWLLKMQRNKKCTQPPDFQFSSCICSSSPLQQVIEDCEHIMWRTAAPAGILEIIIQVVAVPWALKGIRSNNACCGFCFALLFSVCKNHVFCKTWAYHPLFLACLLAWKVLISSFLPFISF